MSREEGLYKDKIEVSLDGRQIFYLFFGGSVIVGLVFVLGVMVGRRVEARGHVERAQTQAAVDPLAALDHLEGGGGLSFQGSLRGGDAPASDVEKQIGDIAKAKEPVAKVKAVVADVPKPEPKAVDKPVVKPEAADQPVVKPDPKPEPRPEKKDPEKKDPEKKAKFTLQLSSFQDKGEAEAYLATIKANGFSPSLTEADVDGKTYYRVRLGNYRSLDAANDAKADVEKATKKSASVMRL
ncbi:MAG: SPOR domain-containing protein [Kofleriaceae bacterium]